MGNFLTLERWMDEDWFTSYAAADDWDEWHFVQTVGANASSVLNDHFDSWVSEEDVQTLADHGINQVRIPVGFWSFIPTVDPEP